MLRRTFSLLRVHRKGMLRAVKLGFSLFLGVLFRQALHAIAGFELCMSQIPHISG